MPIVTFVLGLCGSGKSHLLRQLQAEDPRLCIFDEGFAGNAINRIAVLAALSTGASCAVADAACLCEEGRRQVLQCLFSQVDKTMVHWLCFENDLASANHNCLRRSNKGDPEGHMQLNSDWTRIYTYPPGALIRPVFRIP